jgi:excisionase family DNA binding protein
MEGLFVISVRKAARLLDVSETAIHNAITRGELRATHVGRRVVVNAEDVGRKLKEAGVHYSARGDA